MAELISGYVESLNKRYVTGISREHAYRGDLQFLLEQLLDDVLVTNEPARIECGSPDFILTKKGIPVGYIEAKDIGRPLNSKDYSEQFSRYKSSLSNLIITDYLKFQFFLDGELVTEIEIAEIDSNNHLQSIESNFKQFLNLISDFAIRVTQSIKSPNKLSRMMASKARLLANIIESALNEDTLNEEDTTLKEQMKAFKNVLIHDITNKQFADIYAQTIAYGMFAARLHDSTLSTFSRQEAAELIPQSNPFLRKLFQYIAGYDLDSRISWIIDALADVFRATDVEAILKNFGVDTRQHDPIIHFYETFLAEYDSNLRKQRGVWYTPEPVVKFIVKAVDSVLKSSFKVEDGIANTSKTTIQLDSQVRDNRTKSGYKKFEKEVHRIQILDPATGTGTFLAEVFRFIYNNYFTTMKGTWSSYVEQDLIPRVNGFELLMASYAVAHLKLELILDETEYRPIKQKRLNVYLTNTLEEAHPETGSLFANWLSKEASEANHIKMDSPVMVILGNPPYSGESANKGKWISNLLNSYKIEPNTYKKLQERNSKWINDDYVKFIRYGQHLVEKNGEGVVAFINPHGILDNPTFRGVRWQLLNVYDEIYTIDLHGNSNRSEKSPDGSIDENVFDILTGVSINIFVKTGEKEVDELAKVFHHEIYGSRKSKYEFLLDNSFENISFCQLEPIPPFYFMVPKDLKRSKEYMDGFSLKDIFVKSVMGFQTHRDHFNVSKSREDLVNRVHELMNPELSSTHLAEKYSLKSNQSWNLDEQRKKLSDVDLDNQIAPCTFRLFDNRYVFTHKGFNDRPRPELLSNVNGRENICLLVSKQQSTPGFRHCYVTDLMASDCVLSSKSKEGNQVFYLYSYDSNNAFTPNIENCFIDYLTEKFGVKFSDNERDVDTCVTPMNIFDYIYAVLHSKKYRLKYEDFLKSDFPRIPFTDFDVFKSFFKLGNKLRNLHLMKSAMNFSSSLADYPQAGSNRVTREMTLSSPGFELLSGDKGKVWVNDEQFFQNIPRKIWELEVGGYQPAQKWLSERFDTTLSTSDIRHYQKIIFTLSATIEVMEKIDSLDFKPAN
jgi:predicted helicase